MKLRNRFLLSALAGLLALSLYTTPMWWGVLFSPAARSMSATSSAAIAETDSRFQWESGDVVFRLKALDLFHTLLHR